jgi:hypothetical protein
MHSLRIVPPLWCTMYFYSLSDNSIGDAGIQALTEGIKHCPMEILK